MAEYKYDLLVFIGRFQPFHMEHKRIIDTALRLSKYVLVLVGSAGSPRTIRNPFTFDERRDMIHYTFLDYDLDAEFSGTIPTTSRIIIKPLYDKTYNDTAWINQVQHVVKETTLDVINNGGFRNAGILDAKVGLIGMAKDHTSYYLKMFPQFDSVDVPLQREMHATAIRNGFLDGTMKRHEVIGSILPPPVANFMYQEFVANDNYWNLRYELEHVRAYQRAWKAAPYPVKHVTVDAVVEQSGHILLVKRKSEPGKGLWALPGGHLNEYEKLEDGMIRELREETKIKVPDPVLRGSIEKVHTFDDPHRSTIGRVITQAFHIKLQDRTELPKIKGSDDAEKAKWVPISDIREDMLFDDHYHIIQYFVGAV